MRRAKSLRIGVNNANAVVWEPVYRTRLRLHRLPEGRLVQRTLLQSKLMRHARDELQALLRGRFRAADLDRGEDLVELERRPSRGAVLFAQPRLDDDGRRRVDEDVLSRLVRVGHVRDAEHGRVAHAGLERRELHPGIRVRDVDEVRGG